LGECSEKECRYFKEVFEKQNGVMDYYSFCTKKNSLIPEEVICNEYLPSHFCFNCKHQKVIVYESGEIDSIDYHCKLQNDKFIFSDLNWAISHYADFLDCPITKWEEDKT
jgi:hypothetical protein